MVKIEDLYSRSNLKQGIFLMLLSWLCFSTLFMLSKFIEEDTTVSTMIFFRSALGLVALLPWAIAKWPTSIEVKDAKVVTYRSLLGLLNLFFILLAVERISLINTTLLNNSAPFFVPIILWLWLKKPIDHKLWPAILFGFIGIALILKPDTRIFNVGAAYGLLSGIGLALTLVMTRIASKRESIYSFMLYFFAIGTLVSLPFAILNWKIVGLWTFIALLGIGATALCGQVLMFHALKYGKLRQLAPFSYSAVIFSGIYEYLIWGNVPPPIAYLGIALIVAAGIWIVYINQIPKE